jgi:hemolysin activation/secretion protein
MKRKYGKSKMSVTKKNILLFGLFSSVATMAYIVAPSKQDHSNSAGTRVSLSEDSEGNVIFSETKGVNVASLPFSGKETGVDTNKDAPLEDSITFADEFQEDDLQDLNFVNTRDEKEFAFANEPQVNQQENAFVGADGAKEIATFTPPFLPSKNESYPSRSLEEDEVAFEDEFADDFEEVPFKSESAVNIKSQDKAEAFTPPFLATMEENARGLPSGQLAMAASGGSTKSPLHNDDADCKQFTPTCEAPNWPVGTECVPKYAEPPTCSTNEDILVKEVTGVRLLGSEKAMRSSRDDDSEIQFIDLDVPGSKGDLSDTLSTYVGKPLRACDLISIKRDIILFYRDSNRPLVSVQVPEQDVTEGIIQFIVTESTLDKVEVRGNRYFSKERYSNAIKVKKGEKINENLLLNNLNYINHNPFRRADLVYAPGSESDTTDLEILVNDRFPLNGYAGVDNTGLQHIDRTRIFAGGTWGNAFGLDQILTVQYSMAPDPHKFNAITGSYTIPIAPIQHFINIFGGYSQIHADLPFESRTNGRAAQASLRYTIPLPPSPWILQEFIWGFDFKRANNTAFFVESGARAGRPVNLTQFMIGYNLGYERGINKLGFDAEIYTSPFSWVDDQSQKDFKELNPAADHTYVYGRSSINYKLLLPKSFYWTFNLAGQVSTGGLLPSEELGLGGFSTVRGYEERQLNADDGVLFRTEFLSPKFSVFLPCKRKIHDKIQFLAFLDYGFSHNILTRNEKLAGMKKNDYVLGVGPGIRYNIDHYLQARFDWGIKLHKNDFPGGWSMIHFSVVASY